MGFFSRLRKKVKEVTGKVVSKVKGAFKKEVSAIKVSAVKTKEKIKTKVSRFKEKEKELRERETRRREEVGETGLDVVKRIALPEDDISKEIVMAVTPIGKVGKGIKAGKEIIGFGAKTGESAITAAKNYWTGISKTALNTGKLPKLGPTVGVSAQNTKTVKQVTGIMKKFFSPKALTFYLGWTASVGMGIWANAEAPEGITFPVTKFLIPEAERTGDWTAVNEALALADEITDLSTWEKIIALSPLGIIPGALNKLKGNIAGIEIQKKIAADKEQQQIDGTDEATYWKERRAEEQEQDRTAIDFYNQERKLQLEWEREAKRDQRNEDAEFWRKEREKQSEKETEDRKAIGEFWAAYRKEMQKIAENSRPSNLNFGLI